MNVSGVGGAASLPMTLPSSTSPSVATGTGATNSASTTSAAGTSPTGTGSTSTDGTGEVRLPGQQRTGQQRTQPTESANRTEKEAPKPTPLPPLKGLTVAEIRAMLGVAPLSGQADTAATADITAAIGGIATATLTTPSRTTAFLQRYT